MKFLKNKMSVTQDNKDLTRSYTFISLFISIGLTAVFYKLVLGIMLPGTYYDHIFTQRGSIPYMTTLLFFWGACLLVFSWLGLRREIATFTGIKNVILDFPIIDKESAHSASDKIKQIREEQHGDIASNRFLRAMRRIGDGIKHQTEVLNMLRDQGDIDSMIISTKNAPVRFFIWLIPVFGFIGTVLGVSEAISGFSDIIQAGSDFSSVKSNLGGVSVNLGVAFDTTLLALFKTAILMFAYSSLQKQEQSLLINMDEFSVDDLIKKVVPDIKKADKTETGQLTDAIEMLTEKITTWDPRFADTLDSFFNRFKQYSDEAVQSTKELFAQVKETTGQNSQAAVTISESFGLFKQTAEAAVKSAEETAGKNSETAISISHAIAALELQIREFNSLQSSLQNNIKCITDLEEFNRALGVLSSSLDQLPAILKDMKRPREIRLTETRLEDKG